jgi:DHA1 family bicyclomycin/chloramphenicol resistance-like MFS transporter
MSRFHIAPHAVAFTVLLGVLAALPVLSIDLSAPTLPLLPAALGTTTLTAGLTLSLFMGGFALGQLAGGHLSDRHGRRPVLLAGMTCFALAGAACAVSQTGAELVAARMIQGLGAGACSVLSFAIVQDLFKGDAARNKRSFVTVVFGAVPIFAPALGSFLIHFEGWRAVHGVLALAGAALALILAAGFAESRQNQPRASSIAPNNVARPHDPIRLWRDREFWGLTLANALSYGCIFGYIAGSPVVIMHDLGFSSAVFATVFAGTAAALTAGAWTGGMLGRRGIRAATLIDTALSVTGVASCALAMSTLIGINSPLALIPLLVIVLFCRGVIAPNLQHLAIERRQHQAGAASAAVGCTQLLFGGLTSAAVAVLLPGLHSAAVALPMGACAVCALAMWRATMRDRREPRQHLATRNAE